MIKTLQTSYLILRSLDVITVIQDFTNLFCSSEYFDKAYFQGGCFQQLLPRLFCSCKELNGSSRDTDFMAVS